MRLLHSEISRLQCDLRYELVASLPHVTHSLRPAHAADQSSPAPIHYSLLYLLAWLKGIRESRILAAEWPPAASMGWPMVQKTVTRSSSAARTTKPA